MAVVVAGALANKVGSAGEAWVRMSWVRGLERLGLEVRFVEQLADPPAEGSAQRDWFGEVTRAFGLAGRATLLSGREAVVGPPLDDLLALAPEATLVNISGHLTLPELLAGFRRRVMVDIDPGFTQFWHAAGIAGANVDGHDLHFTIGELIGSRDCPIPTAGINWLPVRQPVVLDDWPVTDAAEVDRFTTIASWRGAYGPVEHDGRTYGLKVHEFRKFIALPQRARQRFEIALDIHAGDQRDRAALQEHGWRLTDPRLVAGDPDSFRAYVQNSGAEFSVAQGVYVDTQSGWFSDRTTRYLASGKPALVQDTGFSRTLPVGEGVVAFRSLDQAAEAAADIVARYPDHSAAARRIAEDYFGAERVLEQFCATAEIT
jgi:hypothetical protein